MNDIQNNTDNNPSTEEDMEYTQPKRRPWLILGGIVIIVAIITTMVLLLGNGSQAEVAGAEELNFAEVVITDLVQEETFNGTLGSIETDPITAQREGTITKIPAPGDTVSQGEALFAIDDQPVVLLYGDLPAFRDIAIGERSVTVSSHLSGTITWVAESGTVIQQGDILYKVDDKPVVALYGNQPAYRHLSGGYYEDNYDGTSDFIAVNQTGYDVLQLEEALEALGYNQNGAMSVDGWFNLATVEKVTKWQRDVGATVDGIVHFGEIVFIPGPAQVLEVFAIPGDLAGGGMMVVSTGNPASGPDVLQLEEGLVALGYDAEGTLIADGIYTLETTHGVLAFQAAAGLEQDGIIELGEVVFLPGGVRITSQLATKGSSVGVGSMILGISLSEKVVKVDLPADEQDLLAVGDAVTVEMPDNTEVPATVVFVSQKATAAESPWDPPTFEVRIEFNDPSVAEGLDEAPVDVIVISDSVEDVMAVPVSALVALLEGGYAVEVDIGNGLTQYISVEVGFFGTNNMIAITSTELQPGDMVVVP